MSDPAASREWFNRLSVGALSLVDQLPDDAAHRPGLGNWTLGELAVHTLRAWTTLTKYLSEDEPEHPHVISAADYLVAGLTQPGVHEGVEQRARADAAEIGDSLSAAAHEAFAAAREALGEAPNNRVVATRFGNLQVREYLRTRNLELAVHGLDLAGALDVEPPAVFAEAAVPALALLGEVAAKRGTALELVRAATGRAPLRPDYTLLH
ncbi:maleylpyruvate isomerase N-terminal domain-containing protein [Propionibacteriaceae bacterium G1746]|uniref:maleylpyruvate isomerase N-terminal domain-containing protein n=1 Tax=Aestuariimicrobium sp. G57 TaxID=3418485 RepID=UPI003C1C468A